MHRKIGILTFAFFISCQRSQNATFEAPPAQPPAAATPSAFFSTVVPGGIANGKIYLAIPLLTDQSHTREEKEHGREAFFRKAVPLTEKWSERGPDSSDEGYGGDVIPDQYLDRNYIEASTAYKIGQSLSIRTRESIVPIRITRHEIHFSFASATYFLYAVGDPTSGVVRPLVPQQIFASAELPDCGKSCALSRNKPDADKTQKVRAMAIDKLGVQFTSDIPDEERTETLLIYVGHFTRPDTNQYVAFFSRHSKEAGDVGKWVTYVLDSDFSLIFVLGRDSYLQLKPDGVADVNGDGLDEIWCNDVGYEGTSYSLWYLGRITPPSFKSVEWPYFGL